MAGEAKNQETVARGGSITLDVYFYNYTGGSLTDPDSIPTYEIKNPDDTVMASGSGTKVSTGYYTATYSVASDATISSTWKIEWTAEINGTSVSDAWEYFEVIAAGDVEFDSDTTATITEYWLNLIKIKLGYPSVDKIILTDAQIKSYCIYPALREYFTKFPIEVTEEHSVSTSTDNEIDFPDTDTFGIIDARLVGKMTTLGSGSTFWDLVYYNSMNLDVSKSGYYGIDGFNPNSKKQAVAMLKQAIATQANEATVHIRVDEPNRKLYLGTNISGKCNVTWAKSSEDFDDVKFVYKMDVVKLSQAYLKEHLADTTGMITKNLEVDVDSDRLKSEANELRREITEKWAEIPHIVVIRQ